MADDDDAKIAEELLIMRLLAGFDDTNPRIPNFIEANSPDERRAREALARQVREGRLGGFVKEFLALAIDPWTESTHLGMRPLRKVEFKSATPGPAPTWARDLLIIDFMRRFRRETPAGKPLNLEAAIKAAEDHFGISRSQAHAIWQRHEQLIDRQSGQ
jgi:hypothetical protein